jgi:O-antigen/teichoic acid export membrane protein
MQVKNSKLLSRNSTRSYLTAALGIVLLAILALMVLIWFLGYQWRGVAVLGGIVLLMMLGILIRVRHNIETWTPKKFYFVRLVEILAAICLLGAGYLWHMQLVATYCVLGIVVIDRLLHIFFRLQMPVAPHRENKGEPTNKKP